MEFCAFFDSADHKLCDTSVIEMYLVTFDLLLKANLKEIILPHIVYSFSICWLKYVCILFVGDYYILLMKINWTLKDGIIKDAFMSKSKQLRDVIVHS